MANNLTVNETSRYRGTKAYSDSEGRTFFGIWSCPDVRQTLPPTFHVVEPEEVNRPDLISYRVYGDESMFWAICVRNVIIMPLTGLTAGQVLVCPHIDDIMAALGKAKVSSDRIG